MPNYSINIGLPSLNKAKSEIDSKIKDAYAAIRRQFLAEGSAFKQKWAASATKKLRTSNNYINHLQEEVSETGKEIIFTISHEYLLANGLSLTLLLENGFGPFDMKSSLYSGKNVKISKKGYLYRLVPFNYHNPFREGSMTTPPHITDAMHEAFTKIEKAGIISKSGMVIMSPKNLQAVGYDDKDIKNLLGEKKLKTGKYNLKDVNLTQDVRFKKRGYPVIKQEALQRSSKSIFAVNYKWKTEKFMRMQKKAGGTGGKVYQTYTTIRTMSSNPYQNQAFIHPGLKPLNIFRDVYEVEKNEIPKRIEAYLTEFLRSVTGK